MLLLLSGMINGRIAILTKPVFHFVLLSSQEVENSLDSIILGEDFVMRLVFLLHILVHLLLIVRMAISVEVRP